MSNTKMPGKPHHSMSLASIYGAWEQSGAPKGLIEKIKKAWDKPLAELTNGELAALLRQRFGVEYVLPLARERLIDQFDDETESSEGELAKMVEIIDLDEDFEKL